MRLNVPVNKLLVMSGRNQRFLGLTSTVGSLCFLLKDPTRCRLWGSNPGPLDSESDALSLRHRVPYIFCFITILQIHLSISACYDIAHCKSGHRECGETHKDSLCNECNDPYFSGGWGRGCLGRHHFITICACA